MISNIPTLLLILKMGNKTKTYTAEILEETYWELNATNGIVYTNA
jgi:hypothetical protein